MSGIGFHITMKTVCIMCYRNLWVDHNWLPINWS